MTHLNYAEFAKFAEFIPETTGQMLMMHQFNAAINSLQYHIDLNDPNTIAGLNKFIARFHDMVSTPGAHPNDYFPYIHHGAFKECYESYIPGYIIKFSADAHQVRMEQALLQAARDNDIEEAFLHTHFIDIHTSLLSWHLDPDDLEFDEDDPQFSGNTCIPIVAAMIQPMICSAYAAGDPDIEQHQYDANPIFGQHGNPIPRDEVYDTGIESHAWIQRYIVAYGDDSWNRLRHFIDDFNLSDLHDQNIGYTANRVPVIFDWLSRDVYQPKPAGDDLQLTIEICG